MLASFFFFFLLLLLSSSSSFPHTTATYSRRLLQHTFLPLSTTATSQSPSPSPPPQNQSVTQTPLPKPFFPTEIPPPPPPFRSSSVTLPANISDLILPHPPPPKHFSKIFLLIVVALISTALISILTLFFYCRKRRRYAAVKAQRSDGIRLYPANTTTSDGGRKPADASLRGSDFLYLGTVVSSQHQGEDRGAVPDSSVAMGMQSASSGYHKLGSPELHPLPPLPRQVFRSGCLSEGEMEDDGEEFFSPRGSLGGGRGSPATTDPNVKVEVFKDVGVPNLLKKSSGARSPSSSPSSSWASSNSASLGSNKSKSPYQGAKWPHLALSPTPPSPLNRRNTISSSQSPVSSCSSLSSSSHTDSSAHSHSQQSRGSEDRRGFSETRAITSIHVASIPPAPPPPPAPLLGQQRRQPATTVASLPLCEPVQEIQGLMGEGGDGDKREGQKPKLKALHWDKVRASSDRAMVWDQLKSSSFQLNEEMIETLFVVNGSGGGGSRGKENVVQVEHRVALDQRKSHNIAILLRALNVTNDEVCEALLEGNVEGLGREVLESLLKMALSKEEEMRLKGFKEDEVKSSGVKLGAAERFLRDVINIPFAFKRINAMLYMANFDTEVEYLITSFNTLEVACEELRKSKMFLKVLEAVLKTGNRMNVGTNRGDALAFKLDTLLKLVDVKGGGDGKTTLLHFVVQEMMTREEKLVVAEDEEEAEADGEMGKKTREKRGVEGLSRELMNVKKAAGMDSEVLRGDVVRVLEGIGQVEEVVELNDMGEGGWWYSCKLSESMKGFLREGREMVRKVEVKERGAMSVVRETTEYFHGDSAKEEAHPLRIFMVVRDFLSSLDRVCSEVRGKKMKEHRLVITSATPIPPPHHSHSGSEVDG